MSHEFDTKSLGKPRRHKRTATGYLPEVDEQGQEKWPKGDEATWKAGLRGVDSDVPEITKNIVHHVQTTLARQAYNIDDMGAYQATALAVREDLIVNWNETQLTYTKKSPKRAYYLSLEFLMGRTLDNALLNLGMKDKFSEGVNKLGFNMEDVLHSERDAALGNGGLGRLAACYVDSSATCELPVWGYGLRYQYGMFQQLIAPDGSQLEAPDPWLDNSNPWEIPRLDVTVDVRFGGHAEKLEGNRGIWSGGQEVLAIAYDCPIPGSDTKSTNNIRFWSARPRRGFDLQSFNAGNYERAVETSNSAANITNVLYPNDNHYAGKTLRLQQQYFWCAASLSDIMRRFKNTGKDISEFPNLVAIQLNDTHPTLAIPELMRILVDEEDVEWNAAWDIVTRTFSYTNHTVLPEALEKWPVQIFEQLLPRHLQIIYDLNWTFLQAVAKKFPNDVAKMERMSLIEEANGRQIRMANLAVLGSFKVNGVAELHSELVRTTILKDFVDFYGISKFANVTNGITPRRWLDQCNPSLSALITETLGSRAWLKDLYLLKGLLKYEDDVAFHKKWAASKANNKQRLAAYIKSTLGVTVDPRAMFVIQVKRIHEYKRQSLNILGVIHRYLTIKAMTPEERAKVNPRVVLFAGKAAPGYWMAKLIIRLIVNVGKVINSDPDVKGVLTVLFLPDYSVSLAELLIPASDISEHISTAGTEASGTSNMKFCLNGGLLLGTVDGANIEIAEEVGEDNVFFFGHLTPAVEELRYNHRYNPIPVQEKSPALAAVLDNVMSGCYGEASIWEPFINTVRQGDYYLISDDFDSYLNAQAMVDEAYTKDPKEWIKKSINTTARMGKFSSDRAIMTYAEEIWNIEPVKI
ncbi:glycosyltransferase family 35 protein [Serendipita vermifera MAFF 305830]|uniref:Alpha-1,4 glucan phosphorylase n=1 Tax=Serendipita vermifera MAFF 305830 TaxID=933852 RepID=A0A0C3BAQ6_SERVB|nr:glycosyltransferase family 35 protein [Serendipita vermifera MAFF 305830]